MKTKSLKSKFDDLKKETFSTSHVQLAVLSEYKRDHKSHYNIKYVGINDALERKLLQILKKIISKSNHFDELKIDSPELDDDQIKGINYEETDYFNIQKKLIEIQPEETQITSIDDLVKAKAYLVVIRNSTDIISVGFKTLPESWKMKQTRGLIPLLFRENRFEDLDEDQVFSIASNVDFIFYQDALFVLSRKNFERGLNFREGMKAKAEGFYDSVMNLGILSNIDTIRTRVGDNQRYLRKIAVIENLALYKHDDFIKKLKQVSKKHGWNIEFNGNQIVVTEESVDLILTVLQNKRLYSELTDEMFDVDSAKKVE